MTLQTIFAVVTAFATLAAAVATVWLLRNAVLTFRLNLILTVFKDVLEKQVRQKEVTAILKENLPRRWRRIIDRLGKAS